MRKVTKQRFEQCATMQHKNALSRACTAKGYQMTAARHSILVTEQ